MNFNSLEELLINELRELYDAELQLVKGLSRLFEASSTLDLKEILKKHLLETKEQIKRLESALSILDAKPEGVVCHAMKGLIEESDEISDSTAAPSLKDAGLIGAVQKIKHYEIACYGTAIAHAKILDLDDVAEILHQSLEEEATTDKKLTKIAEGSFFSSGVNKQAVEKPYVS